MKKKFLCKCLILLGLLLFFAFVPHIMPNSVSIVQASEIEKEKNNEYRLNLKTVTLVNGKSFTLKVYNLEEDAKVSFKSANPEIASVDENGTFTAHKVGTTTITATVRRGLNTTSLTCEVTIGPPAFSVKMTRSMVILGLDQSDLLEVIMKPSNTAELAKFSSFDPSIASVSSGGRITAKKLGMTYVFAEINATNQDGSRKFASCRVIVSKPEEVSLLKDYFSSRSELSLVSEAELSNALYEFFNRSEDTITESPNLPASDNTLQDNGETTSDTKESSELSLIEALDKYLNSKFDLAGLKQRYEESLLPTTLPTTEIQLSSLYGFFMRR